MSSEQSYELRVRMADPGGTSRRTAWLFYLGVFLTFAPVLMLCVTVPRAAPPVPLTLAWFVASGVIGAGWAFASVHRRWWIFAVVGVFHALVIAAFAGAFGRSLAFPGAGVSLVGLGSVALLAAGYGAMVQYLRREGLRALRAHAEMELAARIHAHLVPAIDARIGDLEVDGLSRPSGAMGGDFAEAVERPDGSVDLVLADASGHGVRAGVLMAMVKSAMHATRDVVEPVESFLARLNRIVTELREPGMFVTMAVARVHPDRRVTHALAGHLPILLRRGDRVQLLEEGGLPLGVLADATYECGTTPLEEGDALVLYSDGLVEAADRSGAHFGDERLVAALEAAPTDAAGAVRAALLEVVDRHGAGTEPGDDRTVLVARLVRRA